MVSVSGTVSAAAIDGNSVPVAGATVRVAGTSNSVTSDMDGNFSIMVPVGTVMFLNTADGHWGSLFAENVPAGGRNDLDVEVIPDDLVNGLALGFETTADTEKGIVAVVFDETTTVGGEMASISTTSELSFVFDAADDPFESDTLIADGGSEVIFLNADLANTVTADAVSAANPPQGCPQEFQNVTYSVLAKVLTEIDVDVVCAVQQ